MDLHNRQAIQQKGDDFIAPQEGEAKSLNSGLPNAHLALKIFSLQQEEKPASSNHSWILKLQVCKSESRRITMDFFPSPRQSADESEDLGRKDDCGRERDQ
jgi:hypothetical protein